MSTGRTEAAGRSEAAGRTDASGHTEASARSGGRCAREAQPAPAAGGKRRRWCSQELLGSQTEAEITHAGAIYRLRLTALGKLILTK